MEKNSWNRSKSFYRRKRKKAAYSHESFKILSEDEKQNPLDYRKKYYRMKKKPLYYK